MKIEKLFLPLTVFAAVIAVYLAFRGTGNTNPASTIPNTASSGVPATYSSGGVVQPVNYDVPSIATSPNPLVLLSQPSNPNPQGNSQSDGSTGPAYLTFNQGPGKDLSKTKPPITATTMTCSGCSGGCQSCANQCNQSNAFPDGSGNTKLSSSRTRQLAQSTPGDWLKSAIDNTNAYLALEGNAPAIPTLTSYVPGGMIQ